MANETKGLALIPKSEYVRVVDEGGVVQEHPVPKSWVGSELLPSGWKAATRAQIAKANGDSDDDGSDAQS